MIRVSNRFYRFARVPVRAVMRAMHPVMRVSGKEHIPEGPCILCGNHSALTDPIWVVLAAWFDRVPRTMAKKELFRVPVVNWLVQLVGAFPVDRQGSDIGAIKTALRALREGDKLMIFPEGTRIRRGKTSEPHSGAMLIATRAGVPVVPIYISTNKRLFAPIEIVFGEPICPGQGKFTQQQLDEMTADMMQTIYRLGEKA